MRSLLIVGAVAIGLVLTGCGGGIDKGKLEGKIKDSLDARVALLGKSVLGVNCDENGDSYHFSCTGALDDGTLVYIKATCNSSHGGSCTWRTTRTD